MPAMTKDELIAELKLLDNDYSPENNHREADQALLRYIADTRVTEAFDAIEKWYA